jgi:putative NADPH-quinone reductase
MAHRILIVDGHPDGAGTHFVHELARYYRTGAREGGHATRMLRVGTLEFPLLRGNTEFISGDVPRAIRAAQKSIAWADHLVFLYPLWLGTMPAVLKGFVEQVFRPGFAFAERGPTLSPRRLLKGRSARVVVTTGARGLFHGRHRTEHSLKSFERDLLGFCGIRPVRVTLIEGVDILSEAQRDKAFFAMRRLGFLAR